MTQPDFDRARDYALQRLEQELASTLFYHSLAHTRDDILHAVERLSAIEGVTGEDLLLLRTAACFHDLGFIYQRDGHEALGARIAAEMLPEFGYSVDQIEAIRGMIMATKFPQTPHNLLEQIMADADLDVLGRDDFMATSRALREELAADGIITSDEQWLSNQLGFLEKHRYWTQAARSLRDLAKQQHIKEMRLLLGQATMIE
jgi:uncharacterized protein